MFPLLSLFLSLWQACEPFFFSAVHVYVSAPLPWLQHSTCLWRWWCAAALLKECVEGNFCAHQEQPCQSAPPPPSHTHTQSCQHRLLDRQCKARHVTHSLQITLSIHIRIPRIAEWIFIKFDAKTFYGDL
jgi:hypothetical protein